MRQNQKYFPLFDAAGKLTNKFLIVSNMRLADPKNIVEGNQRVVGPRLEDARFFYNQDRKQRLEERVPQLARVVYHNKLGSQLERVERIQLLAGSIARRLGADAVQAERAAWLAKADLVTNMVGEFPELQGVMGTLLRAGTMAKSSVVAKAIEQHYWPRFAETTFRPTDVGAIASSLADKLNFISRHFSMRTSSDRREGSLCAAAKRCWIRSHADRTRNSIDAIELIDQAAQFFMDPEVHRSSAAFLKKTTNYALSTRKKLRCSPSDMRI